jgi:rSAM/selenodomain-associated transferase 2
MTAKKTDFPDQKPSPACGNTTLPKIADGAPFLHLSLPVLNEDAVINAVLAHLETLRANVPIEIIVVDGDGAGSTIGAIRTGNARTATSDQGRGTQLNRGAAMAEGDIIVFLHADTRLPADAFALMEGALSDQTCVAGAFELAIGSGRPIYRLIAGIASFRTRLTRLPYGDQAHFFRRVYFNEIGGFANIPLMEDVEIMGRIKKRRDRITVIKKAVMTSPRRWEMEGISRCTLRNWLLISLYYAGVSPERLSRFYR